MTPPVEPIIDPAPDRLQEFATTITAQLASLQQNQAELARIIAGGTPKPQPVAPPSYDRDTFLNEPSSAINQSMDHFVNKVIQHVSETVKPLNEFKKRYELDSALSNIKSKLRSNPAFADIDKFSHIFDNLLSSQTGEITEQTVLACYYTAKGMFGSGIGGTPVEAKPVEPKVSITPPYIKPSQPVQPNQGGSELPVLRELTEQEKTITKNQGVPKLEFLFYNKEITKEVYDAYKALEKGK